MFFNRKIAKENYRADIDGIRAIAVLSVIFYHFGIPGFSGGFIGVDVFFVISGYLITKGIVNAIDYDNFIFSSFCLRRVRRLVPALLITIAVTYVASFFVLAPKEFSQLSGSAVYALSGLSNFFFWMQSGYFDNFSTLKPLLHTWSLSVELQFYLLWPFYILFLCRLTKKNSLRIAGVFVFIAFFSFISIWCVSIDSTASFFLTPFRMHEFAIGAIVVLLDSYVKSRRINSSLYLIGLLCILYSVFVFDVKQIIFPGWYVLIPCLGTALLIFSGKKTNFSGLLSHPIPVHIGEISYSLYLVHWPVYVLASYILVFSPGTIEIAGISILTITLSYLLYYGVEKKYRTSHNSKLSGSAFALGCSMTAFVIVLPSANSWANDGWVWRLPEEIRSINNIEKQDTVDYTWKQQVELNQRKEFISGSNKERVLVIGDSQSADLINMMLESGTLDKKDVVARTVYFDCGVNYLNENVQDKFFYKINKLTIAKPELIPRCKTQMNRAMNPDLLSNADVIYVAFHYQYGIADFVVAGIEKLRTMTNAKIYLVGRKNLVKNSLEIVNSFNRVIGIERYASKFKDLETLALNEKLKGVNGVSFINMMDYICPENDKCLVLTDENKPIFYDPAHFTRYGAKFMAKKVFPETK